ncbi:YfcC family protein [Anaeromicrobium sediminis]|uniref:C4-dicarboxylate ABC transporter permease n=1 Tax=Anaeromicrobium sediminis TaxID=1478221 RepID=A0A267MMP9_9FIRM|nr:Na+/H+ antiporter NhaC family protein [Anaeromicrobium sediminis]PAB60816.1 C4-dicarboxylate ABC transporter permease [Anaeromicrobium sediminis]
MSGKAMDKRKFKVPHTYVILFSVIIVMALLTYVIPAGEFDRVKDEATGRTVVDPVSFHSVDQNPTKFFDLFKSVPNGMKAASGIVFFIFIVGGSFQIITGTGAVEAGIGKIAVGLKGKEKIMIPIFIGLFAVGGGTFGMAEEVIVFVPIGIALARALGYDAITGTAMITLGAAVGFTSGFMNPFTVGVAQGISELPLFSGIGFRLVILGVMFIITTWYVIRYANKVKGDPTKSIVRSLEIEEKDKVIDLSNIPKMEKRHHLVLLTIVVGFGFIIYGVFELGWYITEIGSTFLAMGIIGGFLGKLGPSRIAQEFVVGAKSIVFGALVVGIARGILVVMQDGLIIDSIINGLASGIKTLPKSIAVIGMYIVQIIINFFIPSGSGQAAATMPIMAPLADVIEVNRQVAVTAYQFGDGFTNSIIPTSASLMAVLSIAKISYEKWVKFLWPLMLIWIGTGAAFLIIANATNYGPF